MTTHTEYMDGLFDWFALVTGFNSANIFRQHQQNPDLGPDVEWLTYKEIGGDIRDYPLVKTTASGTAPGEQVDMTRVISGTSIVSVNVFAVNGADVLRNLWLSRWERAPRVTLKAAKAVLMFMGGPRDLSSLSDTKWKHRYQADFTFRVFTERVESDYIVDIVELDGKIDDDDVAINVDRNG